MIFLIFWYLYILYIVLIFISQRIFLFPFIDLWIIEKCVNLISKCVGGFLIILLLLICILILLCSDNELCELCEISRFWHLLRHFIPSAWSILVSVSQEFENDVYCAIIGCRVLYIPIRSSELIMLRSSLHPLFHLLFQLLKEDC